MDIIEEYSEENAIIFLLGNKQDILQEEGEPQKNEELIRKFAGDNSIRKFFRVNYFLTLGIG